MHATGTGGSCYFNTSFTLGAILDPVSVVLVGSFGTKTYTEFNDEGKDVYSMTIHEEKLDSIHVNSVAVYYTC